MGICGISAVNIYCHVHQILSKEVEQLPLLIEEMSEVDSVRAGHHYWCTSVLVVDVFIRVTTHIPGQCVPVHVRTCNHKCFWTYRVNIINTI